MHIGKKAGRWLLAALLAVAAYFAHEAWQTRRGEQALAASALPFQSLAAALAQSRISGRPVLADFSAIWCPACRRLHAEVFTDPAVKAAILSGYELSRIDYDAADAPAFMARYDVRGFPTLLVLDADGRLLRRLPAGFDPAVLAAALSDRPAP